MRIKERKGEKKGKEATIVLPHNHRDRFGILMSTRSTEYPEQNLALQKALKQKQENQPK